MTLAAVAAAAARVVGASGGGRGPGRGSDARGALCARTPGEAARTGVRCDIRCCAPTNLSSLETFASVQEHPIKHSILKLANVLENLAEQLAQEVVIWLLLEAELANVVHVDAELLCNVFSNLDEKTIRRNVPGKPSHSSSMGVVCFFSPIFSYFCLLVAARRPCHGRPPRRKYMKT